jgi:hypothetical protein
MIQGGGVERQIECCREHQTLTAEPHVQLSITKTSHNLLIIRAKMSDITPLFSTILTQHSAAPILSNYKPPTPTDEFLKEAYRIVREH